MRTHEFTCSRCGKHVEELDPSPDSPGGAKPDICSACLKEASQSMESSPTSPAPPAKSGKAFKPIPLCKKCRGTGKVEGLVCAACAGTGTKPR